MISSSQNFQLLAVAIDSSELSTQNKTTWPYPNNNNEKTYNFSS